MPSQDASTRQVSSWARERSAHRVLLLAALIASPVRAAAPDLSPSVYAPDRAKQARDAAKTGCRPLVVHVVPNSRIGVQEVLEFYQPGGEIPADLLARVVIVILPRDRYAKFATELGITDAGGMRTISAYSLDTLDAAGVTTCRAGFV